MTAVAIAARRLGDGYIGPHDCLDNFEMTVPLATLEGSLYIRLDLKSARPTQVCLQASRQADVSRLLVGQTMEEVLRRIPRIYSVCAVAQGTAAVEACEAALGIEVSAHQSNARRLLVGVESAKEHLWRILLDWPRLLGEGAIERAPPRISTLLPAYRMALYGHFGPHQCGGGRLAPDSRALDALSQQLEALLAEAVFGMAPSAWSALQSEAAVVKWSTGADTVAARLVRRLVERGWEQLGRSAVAALPPLTAVSLHARLSNDDAEDFAARPTWGTCRETTPLTRNQHHPLVAELTGRYGNGLLSRVVARLAELADIPRRVRTVAVSLRSEPGVPSASHTSASAVGLSQIEAARGRLIHRVVVSGSRVSRYQIVAPTAWNFHPSGVAAEGLRNLIGMDPEEVQSKASLLIEAIDPCVHYQLTVQREH